MFGFDPDRTPIPPHVIRQMPGSVAWECQAIPLGGEHELVIAMADADDRETVDKLRFVLDREIKVVPASRTAIALALAKYYPGGEQEPDEFTEVRLG